MAGLLEKNQVMNGDSGRTYSVQELLGGGGQGEVFSALAGGEIFALKWYKTNSATAEQRSILENLVRTGPPNRNFLWPIELVSTKGSGSFGYVMPLREARLKGIVDLMNRKVDPTFRSLTTTAIELANSFLDLHTRGFSYRDISFGNIFFDPDTGEIRVCDNDNVSVDGQTRSSVLGTPRFMAPEIVRQEALPSAQTDLYSLAVLLFYLFVLHHPLDGAREASVSILDAGSMNRLYGSNPLFIYDPADTSNRPVPGLQDNAITNWVILPRFIQNLFTRAFTTGLKDPKHGRVRESEWRAAFVRLRDAIVHCGRCGADNFCDVEVLQLKSGNQPPCWSCGQPIHLPFRLVAGQNVVMLNRDTVIYPHHVDRNRMYDFNQPLGAIVRHPTLPDVWGLQNKSPSKWVVLKSDGTSTEIPPGRSVTLAPQVKIHFGTQEGEIRY